MSAAVDNEFKQLIIGLTERLITAINAADYDSYTKLVDRNLTSFEPEAVGNIVGVEFHKFYFDYLLAKDKAPKRTSILSPVVHKLDANSAVIAYVRLNQSVDKDGNVVTTRGEETRVWHKKDGQWLLLHFHRSDVHL
ncbi:calcium/calmodulin-dependent protein kinase type II subunit gamma-like [Oppia nitens]|uniref:calcium/calmodulin-dependent protein kinase type II subunit gamma-like n=1 Tax=Oppia nitens TaxID=1686743 RepID=UPI0023D995D1|nr:calcium/calmodulin-dependent protein kinase type II subunit gamma-like [Oppia nitens]